MLRKLWKEMRWSLRTQVIGVLFAGYLSLLWHWREPWRFEKEHAAFPNTGNTYRSRIAPDRQRIVGTHGSNEISSYVSRGFNPIITDHHRVLKLNGYMLEDPRFLDNDTIVAFTGRTVNAKPPFIIGPYVQFTRRFPEWWWGHLYRPEVWLLPLWLGLIVWTIRKDRAVKL